MPIWITSNVLAGLEALLSASLIQSEERSNGERRFTMLETVREFAVDRQREEDDQGLATEQAHASYFLSLAEEAYVELVGVQQRTVSSSRRRRRQHPAALLWGLEHGLAELRCDWHGHCGGIGRLAAA